MKKNYIPYITAVILFNSALAFAQSDDSLRDHNQSPPAGMELRKVNNDVSVLAPVGTKFYKTNDTVYVQEGEDEYAARNFTDVNKRLKKLEEENKELVEEIKYLQSKLVVQESNPDKDAAKPDEK